jgi:NADPH:quinone reductase-like Zn-dependent oxidoreductase
MRAYILEKKKLILTELPDPRPAENEVLIKIEYVGINYAEILSRKGLYGWKPKGPYIPGMEASGTIIGAGKNVSPDRIGQSVMIGTKNGCYAEKVAVPIHQALSAIPNYSMQENAAFLVTFLTAWVMLFELAHLQSGDTVLITAAAGGVGSAAIQMASKLGCKVYGLAGSNEKINFIQQLGAAGGFNYRSSDWKLRLKNEISGADVILELVGGDIFKTCFKILNPFGRIIIGGFASFNLKKWNPFSWYRTWRDIPRIPIAGLAKKTGAVMASHLGYLLKQPEKTTAIYQRLASYVTQHEIIPVVDREFPFEEALQAQLFIEQRNNIGKVLLKV